MFLNYFLLEGKYYCYEKQKFVDPEESNCEKFEPRIKRHSDRRG